MSSAQQLVALVDGLLAERSDVPWLELRRLPHEPWSKLGESLSAVGNGAALARRPFGYVVVGVDPESRDVVGERRHAGEGREREPGVLSWFKSTLKDASVSRHVVDHPGGRVVLYQVVSASGRPLRFLGRAFVVADGRTTSLERYESWEAALWRRPGDWSAEVVEGATSGDLDPTAVERARVAYLAPRPALQRDAQGWDDAEFLERARLTRKGAITRAALLLLGRSHAADLLAPAVPQLTWVLRDESEVVVEQAHHELPFFSAVDDLLGRIRNALLAPAPGLEPGLRQYDPGSLREAILNAVAHQDYELGGWIHVVETADRLVVTNPARLTSADLDRVVEQGAAGDAVQNPYLARVMARLGLLDLGGGGVRRLFRRQWARGMPLPDIEALGLERVRVTLHGRAFDPAFAPLARAHPTLEMELVRSLDRIQKGGYVVPEVRRELRSRGLVEGKEPITVLAGSFARAADVTAAPGSPLGPGNRHLREAVLRLVRARRSATRADINALLLPRLPASLSERQRRTKVDNVVKSLARAGAIVNGGSRRYPRWTLSPGTAVPDDDVDQRPFVPMATIDAV